LGNFFLWLLLVLLILLLTLLLLLLLLLLQVPSLSPPFVIWVEIVIFGHAQQGKTKTFDRGC
jgi:hypothetical protein